MYRTFSLILLFFLTSGLTVKAQVEEDSTRSAKLTEDGVLTYESNSTGKSYKRVLITSFGSITARYFKDNLYSPLASHYSRLGISSATEHLGGTQQTLDKNLLAAIQKHQPDAVLVIFDSANEDTMVYKLPVIDPRILNLLSRAGPFQGPQRSTLPRPAKRIAEQFMAVLLEPADNKVVWKGEFFVFSNFAKRKTVENITGLLVTEWINNNVFRVNAPQTGEN